MSIESPYSSLLSGSCTTGTMAPCAVGTGTTATIPSSRASVGSEMGGSFYLRRLLRHVLCEALALGPRGLEDEGLLRCLAGRVLLRTPASFSFYVRSGGAVRVALTGLNINDRLGGATGTALAGLLSVGRSSSRLGATVAGVTLTSVTLLLPGLLRRLGPSGHGLP